MSFYMITYGQTQIEELYIGETPEKTIQNARELINQWPEYCEISDEEIRELAENGMLEFDLVEIHELWPGSNVKKADMIKLYEKHQL